MPVAHERSPTRFATCLPQQSAAARALRAAPDAPSAARRPPLPAPVPPAGAAAAAGADAFGEHFLEASGLGGARPPLAPSASGEAAYRVQPFQVGARGRHSGRPSRRQVRRPAVRDRAASTPTGSTACHLGRNMLQSTCYNLHKKLLSAPSSRNNRPRCSHGTRAWCCCPPS
jgi:hypothetical protein